MGKGQQRLAVVTELFLSPPGTPGVLLALVGHRECPASPAQPRLWGHHSSSTLCEFP